MRPANSLKNTLYNSLFRSSLISAAFALLIVTVLIFLSIEKDLRQEGHYLGQLVFKELRQKMNQGASFEEMDQLLQELNQNSPAINYQMYRSSAIQQQFGSGRALTEEILGHLGNNEDATHVESLSKIHYFRNIRFQEQCLSCHAEVKAGDLAGVLDVQFPAQRVRIPIYEVLMGMFLVFSITIISSYLALTTDLLSHMITPLQKLERKLRKTEGHHDLDQHLEMHSQLKEIISIEHSFNAQQSLLREAFHKVEDISIFDQLTHAYNRHQLDRLMQEETQRSARSQDPLSIVMIDLNNFKQINDRLGHKAGDEVLTYFCKVLLDKLRTTDKLIRYGGDEFIALLPDCPRSGAENLLQRIGEYFATHPYLYKGQELKVEFCIGASEFPAEAHTIEGMDLIQLADERMYKEKKARKEAAL
ncbi:GGDEF domain-containing protein [Neptuniibacter halophilus]|uniref:GGDEF domain-containing protein n=1 Tax=Neptuniibacter halophilus TaxID=651666 RepID=UPI00257426AA|nr:GGDEF domain-containing protein [Neptuniibacter halophilus]